MADKGETFGNSSVKQLKNVQDSYNNQPSGWDKLQKAFSSAPTADDQLKAQQRRVDSASPK